jgi:hypothetical protein
MQGTRPSILEDSPMLSMQRPSPTVSRRRASGSKSRISQQTDSCRHSSVRSAENSLIGSSLNLKSTSDRRDCESEIWEIEKEFLHLQAEPTSNERSESARPESIVVDASQWQWHSSKVSGNHESIETDSKTGLVAHIDTHDLDKSSRLRRTSQSSSLGPSQSASQLPPKEPTAAMPLIVSKYFDQPQNHSLTLKDSPLETSPTSLDRKALLTEKINEDCEKIDCPSRPISPQAPFPEPRDRCVASPVETRSRQTSTNDLSSLEHAIRALESIEDIPYNTLMHKTSNEVVRMEQTTIVEQDCATENSPGFLNCIDWDRLSCYSEGDFEQGEVYTYDEPQLTYSTPNLCEVGIPAGIEFEYNDVDEYETPESIQYEAGSLIPDDRIFNLQVFRDSSGQYPLSPGSRSLDSLTSSHCFENAVYLMGSYPDACHLAHQDLMNGPHSPHINDCEYQDDTLLAYAPNSFSDDVHSLFEHEQILSRPDSRHDCDTAKGEHDSLEDVEAFVAEAFQKRWYPLKF